MMRRAALISTRMRSSTSISESPPPTDACRQSLAKCIDGAPQRVAHRLIEAALHELTEAVDVGAQHHERLQLPIGRILPRARRRR